MGIVSDDFNRSNSNPLDGNWTTCDGFSSLALSSNHVIGTNDGQDQFMYWDADTFDTDHHCEFTVHGSTSHGLCTRVDPSNSDDFYDYFVAGFSTGQFYRVTGGSFVQIGSNFDPNISDGDRVTQYSNGNTHSFEVNDVEEDSQTDSNFPDHTAIAIGIYDDVASDYLDDFTGGDSAGVTINLAGTIDSVYNISGVTLYRIMNLSDTISAVFSVSGVTLYRIMDLTGTVDTISSLTCSEITIIYVLNPTSGGLAWGEESPTEGEIAAPWSVWSDGAGGTPTITGDQDWGILSIDTDDEGRSNVYDFSNFVSRTYTLTLNRYGSGSGTPVVQIRGQNTSFLQDDVSPSWETYSVPVAKTWRYVQVRIDYA